MNRLVLKEYVRRHGLPATLVHYGFSAVRKVAPCSILRVFTADGRPSGDGQVPGYVTRELTLEDLESESLDPHNTQDVRSALQRGHRCFANLVDQTIVGHTLYASDTGPVWNDHELVIPAGFDYGYNSHTDPEHRGKRLTLARADTRKHTNRKNGVTRPIVRYVAVDNHAALAASQTGGLDEREVGYLAYLRVAGRYLVGASRGCRELGVSLSARSQDRN